MALASLNIRGQVVDVDIEAELSEYEWTRPRWTSEKLLAASPFRYDKTPSFFVNLTGEYAGTWGDSGYYDEEWKSGNFVKLLAFLRQETYEESEEYLIEKYGMPEEADRLKVRLPAMKFRETIEYLDESIVTPAISGYLKSRGIGEETQQVYGVGYGKQKGFTAIPWRTPDGKLANVMYRATRGKVFFYERGGLPRRRLVYGIDVVRRLKARTVALCEAPIDAMSWYEASAGEVVGIAAGGVIISQEQADLIKRSNVETVILAGDNDKAGKKFNEQSRMKLKSYMRIMYADYENKKDANELLFLKKAPKITSIYNRFQ